MSHIEMICPHCGHQLRVPERFAGQKAGCVHYKGRFQVPDAPIAVDSIPQDDFALRSLSNLESMDIDGGGGLVGGPLGGASLSSLGLEEADDSAGLSPVFAQAVQAPTAATAADQLGCLFWGLAFHLPPVALIWAFLLPKGHSQKAAGLGVSAGFLLLAIVLIAAMA